MKRKMLIKINSLIIILTFFVGGFVLGTGNYPALLVNIVYWCFILLSAIACILYLRIEKLLEKEKQDEVKQNDTT